MEIEMQNEFFVYVDRKPDGTPFYVGKGTAERVKKIDRNKFHTAIRNKYPNWERETITSGDEEWCFFVEEELIAKHGRRDNGTGILVNMTDGGDGAAGAIVTEENKARKREACTKAWSDPELRAAQSKTVKSTMSSPDMRRRISASMSGRQLSDETKMNMSKAQKGRVVSAECREKLRAANLGKKNGSPSEETRTKISRAQIGKVISQETRERLRAAITGKKASAQTKEKISAQSAAYAADRDAYKIATGYQGRKVSITKAMIAAWKQSGQSST